MSVKVIVASILTPVLAVGVAAAFYFYGIPKLNEEKAKRELDSSLVQAGTGLDRAAAKLPKNTLVAGAFIKSGQVLLVDKKDKGISRATLTVTDQNYRLYFSGSLDHYTIEVTKPSDGLMKNPVATYDSRTKEVTP